MRLRVTLQAIARDEDGLTVFELLVALSLLGVLLLSGFVIFNVTFRGWLAARGFADEHQNARLMVEWITRRLRMAGNGVTGTAEFITSAQANSVTFRADIDGTSGAEQYRYYLNQSAVHEEICLPPLYATCTDATITSRGLRPISVSQLDFAYFYNQSSEVELPPPVGPADRPRISRVRITLRLSDPSPRDLVITSNAVVRSYGAGL